MGFASKILGRLYKVFLYGKNYGKIFDSLYRAN